MSERFDPTNIFDTYERVDHDFGVDEGVEGYGVLIKEGYVDREQTVGEIAERAVRMQILLKGRHDVGVAKATQATIRAVMPNGLEGLEHHTFEAG